MVRVLSCLVCIYPFLPCAPNPPHERDEIGAVGIRAGVSPVGDGTVSVDVERSILR